MSVAILKALWWLGFAAGLVASKETWNALLWGLLIALLAGYPFYRLGLKSSKRDKAELSGEIKKSNDELLLMRTAFEKSVGEILSTSRNHPPHVGREAAIPPPPPPSPESLDHVYDVARDVMKPDQSVDRLTLIAHLLRPSNDIQDVNSAIDALVEAGRLKSDNHRLEVQ